MKTTIDIPDASLSALLKLSRAKTKRDAILTAVEEYNRRHAVHALVESFGNWKIASNEEIESADLAQAAKRKR